MGTAYRNRIGCDLISIYMLFYIFLLTFPSVACFRCRRYPLYRREREKVFGLNTLWKRKIQPETAKPPDLFAFNRVCTNFYGRQRERATDKNKILITNIFQYNCFILETESRYNITSCFHLHKIFYSAWNLQVIDVFCALFE